MAVAGMAVVGMAVAGMDVDGMVEAFTDALAMVTAAVLHADQWAVASVGASPGVVSMGVVSAGAPLAVVSMGVVVSTAADIDN